MKATARQLLSCGVLLGVVAAGVPLAQPGSARPRLGYTRATFASAWDAEQRFQRAVSAQSISDLHRPLTRRPHMAGTEAAQAIAGHLERTLRQFGFEVETADYRVWLSHPRRIALDIVAPVPRTLAVREPSLEIDPDSRHPELGDAFVAYSPSGDVTAPVVYVNYGLPDDYARLQALGVSVRGRIALARYARSHRAVKVHTAERAGAAGVLLFSDPADDGFVRGEAWPPGYWRGEQMPQRGNAKYSWFWHGDPLTPGEPALDGAERLDAAEAPTLPKIPVAVVSWSEARHVLSALGGPDAPAAFRGGIPIAYRLGPGDLRVRLRVEMDNRLRPIRNVVARLRGSEAPDRMVLLGGHHDAWTFGGVDPGTGAAALLETARGLGQLAATGWRPKRTIGIAFWDAEEYGLVGSTEFVEHHRRQLAEQLVAYVNTDMYMAGRFDAGGVPSLRDFVADVVKDVPEGQGAVYDRWRGGAAAEVELKRLGSGADFVPFQDHLGAPTLSVEFIGANGYGFGAYHSNYDTRTYTERVADPGFSQGVTLARALGTLAMRMTGADVLPFRFSHAATWLEADLARAGRQDLSRSSALATRIREAAAAMEAAIDRGLASGHLPNARTAALNDRLARLEQHLTDDDGAPERRWYRHVVHGWNIYSLYDGQPFPGLEAAIRENDATRVAREVERIERALARMLSEVEAASRLAG